MLGSAGKLNVLASRADQGLPLLDPRAGLPCAGLDRLGAGIGIVVEKINQGGAVRLGSIERRQGHHAKGEGEGQAG